MIVVRTDHDPGQQQRTLRVSMDVSIQEFVARNGPGIEQMIVSDLANRIAHELFQSRLLGGLDDMIARSLKDEVRAQVKAAVAARIDEFVEEALG